MTVQISFKRNDWIFHTGPWFLPLVSWLTNPNVWTFRFGNFQYFWSIFHFNLGLSRYCVRCLSFAPWQSGYDIHDFCCRHLWCWWSLFCKYCIRSSIIFLQCRLAVQLDLYIFGALSPIRHSSNDRCPSVRQNELLCPSSLLHRSPLICFWLLLCPTPGSFQVSPILYPLLLLLRVFSLLET